MVEVLCPLLFCYLFLRRSFTAAVCGLPLTHRGVANAGTCYKMPSVDLIQQLVLPDHATVLSTGHKTDFFQLLTDPASSPFSSPSSHSLHTPRRMPQGCCVGGRCDRGGLGAQGGCAWGDRGDVFEQGHLRPE